MEVAVAPGVDGDAGGLAGLTAALGPAALGVQAAAAGRAGAGIPGTLRVWGGVGHPPILVEGGAMFFWQFSRACRDIPDLFLCQLASSRSGELFADLPTSILDISFLI